MNAFFRPMVGLVLTGALVLAVAPPAAAQSRGRVRGSRPVAQVVTPAPNALPDPFQTYAGTFLSDCTNANSARLTVVGGVLTFIDGERRVSGTRILTMASDGSAPPVTD